MGEMGVWVEKSNTWSTVPKVTVEEGSSAEQLSVSFELGELSLGELSLMGGGA